MTFAAIMNLLILATASVCLVSYLTAFTPARVRGVAITLFAVSAVGLTGAAVCAFLAKSTGVPVIIFGETAVFLAVLMISFAAGRSERTAALRLCLSPLWAMLIILSSYAASALNDGSAAISALGVFAALMMALPPACDFYRLYRLMKKDGGIAEKRKSAADMRAKKREERKFISRKRGNLKRGKGRK